MVEVLQMLDQLCVKLEFFQEFMVLLCLLEEKLKRAIKEVTFGLRSTQCISSPEQCFYCNRPAWRSFRCPECCEGQGQPLRKCHDGGESFYSNDNRRLYCLKQHQEHVRHHKVVYVSMKLYDWSPAFDRLVQRLPKRKGLDKDYIRVRS